MPSLSSSAACDADDVDDADSNVAAAAAAAGALRRPRFPSGDPAIGNNVDCSLQERPAVFCGVDCAGTCVGTVEDDAIPFRSGVRSGVFARICICVGVRKGESGFDAFPA